MRRAVVQTARPRPLCALFFNYLLNFCGVVKEAAIAAAAASAAAAAGPVNEPTLLC